MKRIITLSGFGELDGENEYKDLKDFARAHGVELYYTYYDHELKGDRNAIEAITQSLWSMPATEWADNALIENPV